MKLSDLKLKDIRNTISVKINKKNTKINIYNIKGEDRIYFKNKIKQLNDNEIEAFMEDLYTELFTKCTDLDIDDNVIDVINNPTGNMLKVLQEIMEIFNEIQIETLLEQYNMVCEYEKAQMLQLMTLKSERVLLLNEKCKGEQKEIKLLKGDD